MRHHSEEPSVPERTGIDALVDQARRGKLSRRKLAKTLAAAGISISAIAVLASVAQQPAQAKKVTKPAPTKQEQQNLQLHQQHLERQQAAPAVSPAMAAATDSPAHTQVEAHVQRMLQDYHPEAVVEDPLAGTATVGHEAIAARKRAEAYSMQGLTITITNRFAVHDQVVAEWLAEGTHMGDFLGYPASNRAFSVRGLTVVTRSGGKIVREVLYYDVDEAKRQLGLA